MDEPVEEVDACRLTEARDDAGRGGGGSVEGREEEEQVEQEDEEWVRELGRCNGEPNMWTGEAIKWIGVE